MSVRLRSAKAHAAAVPVQRLAPRWETTTTAERTNLRCTLCGKTIAYGIAAERAAGEAPFFLEAHQPFCLAV